MPQADTLLTACARRRFPITQKELNEVVAFNDKKRFTFDRTATMIRAQQGHSVPMSLGLKPVEPPSTLYHGTPEPNLPEILRDRLRKMRRHHVHLSGDWETATLVGRRRGRPVVLVVGAWDMWHNGWEFYRSGNGVRLVEQVPPCYLSYL